MLLREWVRCEEPATNGEREFEVVEETEFSFTIRDKVNGERFKCSIDWHGRSNWFKGETGCK